MSRQDKEHKQNYKVKSRPIVSLLIGLGFLSAILLVTMLVTASNSSSPRGNNRKDASEDETEKLTTVTSDGEILAIVKEIDLERKQITLYDIDQQETAVLFYTGGTNITDKYDQIIAISQIQVGTMVEALYQKDNSRLTGMEISAKTWEYVGVSNLNIDRSNRVMKIVAAKYKYTDDVIILDRQDFIPVANLVEQDELTIRGYEETIWSITVTRGHGTVKLEDYEPFLGAGITVGYETMQQITEDMSITVREGNYNLTVEKGDYTATKNISVYRNQETTVTLSDLGPEALKQSRITFEIMPFGADLYIDGELSSYSNPLELNYGEHAIKVSLGGYISYEAILEVDTSGKTIKIDLPEATSKEEAVVSETDTELGENSDIENPDIENPDIENPDTVEDTSDTEGIIDSEHLIYVQSPIGSSVYLNGNFKGISPCNFEKVVGSHVITFIEVDHETMSYTIDVLNDGLDSYFTFPDLVKLNAR
ncbi:MAG: PEGA domain-containing protein [Mobilitalea sp.]